VLKAGGWGKIGVFCHKAGVKCFLGSLLYVFARTVVFFLRLAPQKKGGDLVFVFY